MKHILATLLTIFTTIFAIASDEQRGCMPATNEDVFFFRKDKITDRPVLTTLRCYNVSMRNEETLVDMTDEFNRLDNIKGFLINNKRTVYNEATGDYLETRLGRQEYKIVGFHKDYGDLKLELEGEKLQPIFGRDSELERNQTLFSFNDETIRECVTNFMQKGISIFSWKTFYDRGSSSIVFDAQQSKSPLEKYCKRVGVQ